jgi:pyroglutamyl-peptidase
MKKLLITGFDPFHKNAENPSWLAAAALPDTVGEYELKKLQLPTVYGVAAGKVIAEAEIWRPDAILCLGLAGGRGAVTPERVGINIRSASIADNAGQQFTDSAILPGCPAAYFSTLPVTAMSQAIRDAGLPSQVSNTAGTYVCNDVLYTLLHHFAGSDTRVGFIHVPYLPGQGEPSMPLADTVKALEQAILAIG